MALTKQHLNLNSSKVILTADDEGFTLTVTDQFQGDTVVEGDFQSPELVYAYNIPVDVLEAYKDQDGVTVDVCNIDPTNRAICSVADIHLATGVNWFELNHEVFNRVLELDDNGQTQLS
jgi:hypothetical protein